MISSRRNIFTVYITIYNIQKLSGIFTTSSAPLFTVFTGLSQRHDYATNIKLANFAFVSQRSCYKMMFRQDVLFDLATFSMIWENWQKR